MGRIKFTQVSALLMCLLSFAFLAGLGFWQLQRLSWKETLQSQVKERIKQPPRELTSLIDKLDQIEDYEYSRVIATGQFDHSQERHYFTVFEGVPGWLVFTPFHLKTSRIILVNRGFVPEEKKDPAMRQQGLIKGEQTIIGLVRLSETGNLFTPESNVAKNQFYVRHIDQLGQGLARDKLLPFFIDLEKTVGPGDWPRSGTTRLSFPNKHLGYAITWFGLAFALLAVFIAYIYFNRRRK